MGLHTKIFIFIYIEFVYAITDKVINKANNYRKHIMEPDAHRECRRPCEYV